MGPIHVTRQDRFLDISKRWKRGWQALTARVASATLLTPLLLRKRQQLSESLLPLHSLWSLQVDLHTNLSGRLANTKLPLSKGLNPLFEAVSNSIHAIDEGPEPRHGHITITILRDTRQVGIGLPDDDEVSRAPITGFRVVDNGVGFTEDHMQSFLTLDSLHKADKGGRGIGRLLWLKAFQSVFVNSVFDDPHGNRQRRTFSFHRDHGVYEDKVEAADGAEKGTCVTLSGFQAEWRERKETPKTRAAIAERVLTHCLWYFVRPEGAPSITIADETGDSESLDWLYQEKVGRAVSQEYVAIGEYDFQFLHVKLYDSSGVEPAIVLCASNRSVETASLKDKILGLYGRTLNDEVGSFVYQCYVSSPFLDQHVRPERTGFDIEEESALYHDWPSKNVIREQVIKKAESFLGVSLQANIQAGEQRIREFVTQKAPRYHSILSHIQEDKLSIDPDKKDKDIELLLHEKFYDFEQALIREGHDLMKPARDEYSPDYEKRLQAYTQKVADLKGSDLASYVTHRKIIIDLLDNAIKKGPDDHYAREDAIHDLIMPRGRDFTELHPEECNLWLLDERLLFHSYLSSDKPIKSLPFVEQSDSAQKPDITAFRVFDTPIALSEGDTSPYASLSIIELKHPMRDNYAKGRKDDPIEQVLTYLQRIRAGGVQTVPGGQLISAPHHIPGFCYVIGDMTESLKDRCNLHNMTLTGDGLGAFSYNDNFNAYVKVISFTQLVTGAKERHRTFFDKLGLPTT